MGSHEAGHRRLGPGPRGRGPQSAGQARRALLRLSAADPSFENLHGQYHIRARLLHIDCFYEGHCEPEEEMAGLIRATTEYITWPSGCPQGVSGQLNST